MRRNYSCWTLSKTASLISGQNNTPRAMRTFDSGPKWFAWILSSISACMDYGVITRPCRSSMLVVVAVPAFCHPTSLERL